MEYKSNIDMDIYFKSKEDRNRFVKRINKSEDWRFTAHGQEDIPNSQYVRLYQINRVDLLRLSAILFDLDVEGDRYKTESSDVKLPSRKDK